VTEPVSALTVIYANDLDRVAAFYERTLGVSRLEHEDGFIVVGNSSFEIAVVRMSGGSGSSEISSSFHVRAETPLKGSYLVESLEQAKAAAEASGGSLKPIESAWSWRGQLHLDGHDPEGNVMQIRMSAA
jgi:predicted enzyme related to lactoylglutathione lyase